ncbi:MAG: Uma2 family endonuclease [Bacteroidota bacterium]
MTVAKTKKHPIYYPTSDGKPMAENTIQYTWLTKIKGGLEIVTQNKDIFVAGDLLWYPVEGNNKIRLAPDVMAAVGRPKGHRGSYLQWKEDNLPPQVVFEILSPGNRAKEMANKLAFYEKYGVKEYIIYYPQKNRLTIYEQRNEQLKEVELVNQRWTSQFLGIYLEWSPNTTLHVFEPNGKPFKNPIEIAQERDAAIEREQTAARKAEILAKKLKELGINPEDLLNE